MGKALFWDFDGTLIYPNESFLESLQNAFEKCNYKINIDEIREFLHSVCSWNVPEITYTDMTGQKWWDSIFRKMDLFYESHKILKKDMEKINSIFKNRIIDFRTYTLYADSISVLYECMLMGYKNYIISNNYPELPLVINNFGLARYFTD